MATYITTADVDALLGTDWTTPEKKDRAVMQANAYLTSLHLTGIDMDAIPAEVKQAGAELAKCAADGVLYQQHTEGSIESKSVKAGSVTTAKTFGTIDSGSTKAQAEGIQFALALLNPWLGSSFGFSVFR